MFSASSFISGRISKVAPGLLCSVLILTSMPLPFAIRKAQAQSTDKTVLKRQLPPDYALPKINDLFDEGKRLQRPELPRPALKPSTLCGYRDKACKVKQAKEKKIGQNRKPLNGAATQVASNTERQSGHNWLTNIGQIASRAFSFASPFGLASVSAAGDNSFAASNTLRPANNAVTAGKTSANAAAASMLFTPPTYTSLEETKLDPRYRAGASGEDLFSGNVNYSLPLVNLPGRAGLDVNITLSYNSLIWMKYNNRMQFDPGYYETLTPGFRLGFPEVEGPYTVRIATLPTGYTYIPTYMVTLPSGKRVEMRQVTTGSYEYEAVDGSYLYLVVNQTDPSQMTLYATDGTQFKFQLPSGGYQSRCTQIKDSNGNYITIAYKTIGDPEWPLVVTDKVTDTLGRQIIFNYDANLHLQTITQAWQGQTFIWAQFEYGEQAVNPNFGSLGIDGPYNNETIPVITGVITGDGARHTFAYNSWGQAKDFWLKGEANNQRAALNYAFPAVTTAQSDCPRPTQRNDYIANWAGATGNGWVSSYFSYDSTNETYGQMTDPSGVTHKELFNTSNGKRGLTSRMETWHGGNIQKFSDVTWASDITTGRPLRPRVTDTQTCDDRNHDEIYSSGTDKLSRTAISYDTYASTVKLPGTVKQYNEGGQSVYRTTVTTYISDSNYTGTTRRIIGLPSLEKLYQGDSATLMAQMEYVYDTTGDFLLAHSGQPRQHDSSTNGTAGNYGSNFSYRGNLTKSRRYSVVNGSASAPIETKTGYYITGAPAFAKDALNHQTSLFYDDLFLHYTESSGTLSSTTVTPNPPTYAYPTKVTSPIEAGYSEGFSSTVSYNYDFGAVTRSVDPKTYATYPPPQNPQTMLVSTYDSKGRLDKALVWKDNQKYSQTRNVYGTDHNYLQTLTTVNTLSEETSVIRLLDGLSRERITISDHPGSVGTLKSQYRVFDIMGRVVEASNPTEIDGNWAPSGDDAAGYAHSNQDYDWKGRPTVTTNQNGTTKSINYAGCGCAGAQEVTIQDEGDGTVVGGQPRRRPQKVYYDVLGRVQKVQVMDWSSNTDPNTNVYSTTVNTYNVRDQITSVKQYSGNAAGTEACPSATCQLTSTSYDGHGRLYQSQRPIESGPTTYSYNVDDTANIVTDARGASATFSYNNRKLVAGITYGVPSGVAATPNVIFGYDEAGNRTLMDDGPGRVDYTYDSLSRLQTEARQFDDFGSNTYQLAYLYNLAGEMTQSAFKKNTVTDTTTIYAYDKAGQLLSVGGSGYGGVTQFTSPTSTIKYRAWGAVKQMNYGNGLQTSHTYNARLQLSRRTFTTVNYGASDNDYAYYPDGRLKTRLLNNSGSDFDRSYSYDHAARLLQARTSGEARGLGGTGPYHQDYVYDVWNNLGRTNNTLWGYPQPTDAPTYTNNRHPGNFYDNAGNVTVSSGISHTYNAASRQSVATGGGYVGGPPPQPIYPVWEIANNYDGDGLYVKRAETRRYPNPQGVVTTNYYVRSGVLGGALLVELNA